MARPTKKGLDYFPLDTSMEDKVELLEAKTGLKGFAVLIHLYQKIYANDGYYMEWKDDNKLLFARKIGADAEFVDEVVDTAIKYDIFSEELYREHDILTSHGIQTRYMNATSRRKNIPLIKQYRLLSGEEVHNNVVLVNKNRNNGNEKVNVNNNGVNDDKNPTKKRKEKKRKEYNSVEETKPLDESSDGADIEFGEGTDEYRLAMQLRERIVDWHDPVPSNVPDPNEEDMQKWAKDVDRLLRLGPMGGDPGDGPSVEQVEYIIKWIYEVDDFWRNTIESPIGIRKNISKITSSIRTWKNKKNGSDGSDEVKLKELHDWADKKDREVEAEAREVGSGE